MCVCKGDGEEETYDRRVDQQLEDAVHDCYQTAKGRAKKRRRAERVSALERHGG